MDSYIAEPKLTDAEADALCGARLTNKAFDHLFRRSVRITRPDGSLLACFIRNAFSEEEAQAAYPTFTKMDSPPTNRGIATIGHRPPRKVLRDGRLSNTGGIRTQQLREIGLAGASSGVMGYMDRYPRMPFCRKTAFTMDHPELFAAALPYIQRASALFQEHALDRWCAQKAKCDATSADFVIPGTVFTTITVNKNYPTRVHKDAGDLKEGFGCMSVFRRGHYTGSYFVLPKYRVAFDTGNCDFLLADVHEWHGNTEMLGDRSKVERISCVFYYRERMEACGTAAQELERAKNRKRGGAMA